MARIRTVKPEFFTDYELFQAEQETGLPLRVAFAGLWTQADREGRFTWVPPQLKLGCLPYDEVDFSRVLDALTTRGFIVKYSVNGRDFGVIPSFLKHQVINNREKESDLPPPPENDNKNNTLTRDPRVADASKETKARETHADTVEGKGKEGKGRDKGTRQRRAPTDFKITNEMRTWANEKFPSANLELETEKFKDHEFDKPKKDWPSAWRNWIRRSADYAPKQTGLPPGRKLAEFPE